MTFNPIMFAHHSNVQSAVVNALHNNNDDIILDFSGSEASLFLSTILGHDLAKLTASGFGFKGTLDGDYQSLYSYCVYYFSDTAYRFILKQAACHQLQALMNEQQLRFDIDYVVRSDLTTLTLSGNNAFNTLVDAFKLTPGIRLSNDKLCYGAQSGEVFVTAFAHNNEQQFLLAAKADDLQKWQQYLQNKGFDLIQNHAA
ncbi:hypothetical protein J8L70_02475 [Pseudoalteromonas sp. MMG010]|uniref:hypothetical protein n=1 Tax=Pseudoalteromonas sp. MMG010 TaxID=2822685 RepID=UPI001B3A53D0|nr:hypothetical protein [Pseudoalteromonas sp. MMG010]MBQ4832098.1 hypothetical protein [Pseudoalteromonas sp. MMG010]